jgi:hypothetical protein
MATQAETHKKFCDEQYGVIDSAKDQIQTLADEYREKFDNLSETAQEGEKGQKIGEIADALEEVIGVLEDAQSALDGIEF